jgi:hypothetical protein
LNTGSNKVCVLTHIAATAWVYARIVY